MYTVPRNWSIFWLHAGLSVFKLWNMLSMKYELLCPVCRNEGKVRFMPGSGTVCHSGVKLDRTSTYCKKWGSDRKGDCDDIRDDRFSGDQGVFTGWKQFVLLAKSVYQHGIADLCLGAVNSHCGRELSRHALKCCLHQLHSSPWQPWPFFFPPPPCDETEHYALSSGRLSNANIWQ